MKKKKIGLVLGMTLLAGLLAGCGSAASDEVISTEAETEQVETAESTESETSLYYEDKITYDPADYVTLGDYKNLKIELNAEDYEVTDEDVTKEIEYEITQCGTYYVDSDKDVVEDGDTVKIDYEGKKDGVAFDGGTATGQTLTIGSGTYIDGFESGLIGAKVGETRDLDLTFPEDYGSDELAGEDVVFTVTVQGIMEEAEMNYDLLTDEYVQEYLGGEDVESYIESVRTTLEEDAEYLRETNIQQAVLEKLVEICEVSGCPDGLLEERVEQRKTYYENYATMYGVDLETFLTEYLGTSLEEFETQIESTVSESVKQEMILLMIAKEEGITDDEAGFADYVAKVVSENGFESEDSLYSIYAENYVKRMYCQDTVIELLSDAADVTYTITDETEAATEDATEDVTEETTEENE